MPLTQFLMKTPEEELVLLTTRTTSLSAEQLLCFHMMFFSNCVIDQVERLLHWMLEKLNAKPEFPQKPL